MTATETATVLTFEGTPAYSLSPNSRSHWAVKRTESEAAGWAVKKAMAGKMFLQINRPVRLHWTVYLAKGGKRRDTDNMLPCLKAHLDHIVRSGLLPTDSPTCIPDTPTVEQVPWAKHKGEPRIVLTITPATGAGVDGINERKDITG